MLNITDLRDELKRRVDAIEGGYELMLAYAAQGLPRDQSTQTGGQLREALDRFDGALTGLAELYRQVVAAERSEDGDTYEAFLEVLDRDAHAAQAAIRVVTAQSGISSLLVDNLNASVHVRMLLTDVFVIDEALKQDSSLRSSWDSLRSQDASLRSAQDSALRASQGLGRQP